MSTIGCAQNDFQARGTFGVDCAPILREDLHNLRTDRNKLPLGQCYVGVRSGVPKLISIIEVSFGATRAPILRED